MYPNLKLQIFRQRRHQNELARDVGIDETVLSKIIHGYRRPTETQRKTLARCLDADETWLFESYEAISPQTDPNNGQFGAGNKNHADGDL